MRKSVYGRLGHFYAARLAKTVPGGYFASATKELAERIERLGSYPQIRCAAIPGDMWDVPRKAWIRIFDYTMYPTKPEQDSREAEISDRLGRFLDQHGYAYPSDYIRPDYVEHEDGFCDLTRDAIARTQESNDRAFSA